MATQLEIAEHLDLSERKVRDLMSNGILERDASLDDCRIRYIRHLREVAAGRKSEDPEALDLTAERARLAKEQADNMALKNNTLRGELIPAEIVIAGGQAIVSAAKAKLLGIHAKVRSRHPDISDAATTEIEAQIREALEELGNDGLPESVRKRVAGYIEDMATAAEADPERVG